MKVHRLMTTAACLLMASAAWAESISVDQVKKRLADTGDAAKYDSDAVIVFDDIDVLVRPSGIGEKTTQRVVKVLRDGAVRGQSVQRFDYDPTTNSLMLKAVRVYRADGTVEEVDLAGAAEQPQPQWGIFWGARRLSIAVPRLHVGDAVETTWVKTGYNVAYLEGPTGSGSSQGPATQPPMPGEWYDQESFWSHTPIIEKRYTVRIPREKSLQYAVYNGEVATSLDYDGDLAVYQFEKDDIPAFKSEPWMVSPNDVECKLVLATVDSWTAKSKWFYETNEPSLIADDAIREKVAELVRDCQTAGEKITTLNHWVAENIRYIGTSRGACEGYTVHDVKETFRDRGGVCKDKAAMLVGMLRTIGIDAYVVMTQAGSGVYPVPADQFNHCVACVRKSDGSLQLLDPTWMPRSRDNWSHWESLQHVLYGLPEGHELALSPYFPPEVNVVTWNLESAVDSDGALGVLWNLSAEGGPETALRRKLHDQPPGERERFFEDAFSKLSPTVTLIDYRAMRPTDFSGPFKLSATIEVPHAALGDSVRIVPLAGLRQIFGDTANSDIRPGMASAETRRFPLKMRATRHIDIRETLTLPDGWSIEKLPEAQSLDGSVATLTFDIEKTADGLQYWVQADFKTHIVQPEDYGNFKEVLDALNKLNDATITCRTGAKREDRVSHATR